MNYTLIVQSAPSSTQGASSALRFADALLKKGHSIYRVFFYGDGVHNANALASPPQDEPIAQQKWLELGARYNQELDLVVCIAAAVKRGVINEHEAGRYGHSQHSLADGFELSGLGQLTDAIANSDRVITFGG